MLHFIANGLVDAGIIILILALRPILRLIALFPASRLRPSWYILTALIIIFIVGYGAYIPAFWNTHQKLFDLIVPIVFFLGACFVLVVNYQFLNIARDLQQLAVPKQENITDPVLGIYNRRYLERRLSTEISRANRYGMTLSVLLIDIDHFKRINDSYGHPVGDVVLRGLAQLIVNTVRTTDIVARYGGEEIMVIAPNTPVATAENLAERLRGKIETTVLLPQDAQKTSTLKVTASIGVAYFDHDTRDSRALINEADEALYRAKSEGRNRVVVHG
ncbi:MAG: GGDEF domain-containing protein [Pseudomonadota bacterium]